MIITKIDIKEHFIKDKQDDKLIVVEKYKLVAKTPFSEELNVIKVDMIATMSLSKLISLSQDEILSKYAKSLPEDPINLESITQYLNSVD